MLQTKIAELTPEQEALLPVYLEKWRKIAFSTEPLACQKAEAAVKAAYALMGTKEPAMISGSSTYAAIWEVLGLNE